MALTGLQIYKLLPKTNCKECGFPTCLAFAMKLAQKGAELDACPYVSDEARTALDAASAPPIRLVGVGAGERRFEVGNEVAMFRHEKTFYHQPGLVVRLRSDDGELAGHAADLAGYEVERVGMKLRLDGAAIDDAGAGAAAYAAAVAAARAAAPGLPLVLLSADPAAIAAALDGGAAADRPLVGRATAATWQAMAETAAQHECPLVVGAQDGDLDALAQVSEQVRGAGVEDLVFDPGAQSLAGDLTAFTQLRRLALKKNQRSLGYPILAAARASSPLGELARAAQAIAKYAGVIVLDTLDPALAYTLLTLRQNIYTDPQKPIQVEPRLYAIGAAGPDSPAAHHDQLLAHLLLGLGRGRRQRPAGLAAGGRRRRPVGADRLGGRQVRRREDRQDGQRLGNRRPAEPQEAGAARPRRRPVGRGRGGAARLADHGRPPRRRRHSQLPEERLERLTTGMGDTAAARTTKARPRSGTPRDAASPETVVVTFAPGGEMAQVPAGTSLLDAATAAGVEIAAPCGGQGRCGRCKVTVAGEGLERRDHGRLTAAEVAAGAALACRSLVTGPVEVTVPRRASRESAAPRPRRGRSPRCCRCTATGARTRRCARSA